MDDDDVLSEMEGRKWTHEKELMVICVRVTYAYIYIYNIRTYRNMYLENPYEIIAHAMI